MKKIKGHSFYIPVMGIGFTIDTPIKVAHYGISSVVSLVDDILTEKMRELYCKKENREYIEITKHEPDFRAKRITAYLNLMNEIVDKNFEELKKSPFDKDSEITKYLKMLPDTSPLHTVYYEMLKATDPMEIALLQDFLRNNISKGDINVNIMTKLDKANYDKNKNKLPVEFNDAHAALRGYANSNLESSIIFSAGLNTSLYNYITQFPDFYPDETGYMKKKIVLKVSDFRSAQVQGKYLVKKGLWISEYRIESGLNCGGHTFASKGNLMGPILEEFKQNINELVNENFALYCETLKSANLVFPQKELTVDITAQGGIGTAAEHSFLINKYNVSACGWGTPFLLVPEVVSIDNETMTLLSKAEEKDLYLSNISPLGVPFNSVRGNTKDVVKYRMIAEGKIGSNCPKQYLISNKEFTDIPICTASRRYQTTKIKNLDTQNMSEKEIEDAVNEITEKSCICVGLGTSALLANNLDTKKEGEGVSVCPGPGIAYFSKISTLKEMVNHIYGRSNLLNDKYRPHMFIKELEMYSDFFKTEINSAVKNFSEKQTVKLQSFKKDLTTGIQYYKNILSEIKDEKLKNGMSIQLNVNLTKLENILSNFMNLNLGKK